MKTSKLSGSIKRAELLNLIKAIRYHPLTLIGWLIYSSQTTGCWILESNFHIRNPPDVKLRREGGQNLQKN